MFRRRFFYLFAFFFAIYLIWTLSVSIIRDWGQGERIAKVEARLKKVQKDNQDLQLELSYVQSQDFIERQAREKLNLIYPGETIIILPKLNRSDFKIPQEKTPEKRLPNWRQWLNLFFY